MFNSFNSSIFAVTIIATLIFLFISIALIIARRKCNQELKKSEKVTATIIRCSKVDDLYEQPTKMYEIVYKYIWKGKEKEFCPVYPTSEMAVIGSTVELDINSRGEVILTSDLAHLAMLTKLFDILSAVALAGGTFLSFFAK